MGSPKFQLFKSTSNSEFYFRLKAGNGEIILASEGYTTKQNCQGGIISVRTNSLDDTNYERKNGTNNYTFNLKAKNGEIIGRSENYTTSSAREGGIDSVKKNAPDSFIEDLT